MEHILEWWECLHKAQQFGLQIALVVTMAWGMGEYIDSKKTPSQRALDRVRTDKFYRSNDTLYAVDKDLKGYGVIWDSSWKADDTVWGMPRISYLTGKVMVD